MDSFHLTVVFQETLSYAATKITSKSNSIKRFSRWWFQTCFIFTPILLPSKWEDIFDQYSSDCLGCEGEKREMKLSLKELLKVSLTQRVSWATLLLSGGFFTGMAKEIFGDSGVVQKLCQIRESLKKGDRDIAKENLEGSCIPDFSWRKGILPGRSERGI